jgi:hypothetical protein
MMRRSTDAFDNGIVADCARSAAHARRFARFVIRDANVPERAPLMPPGVKKPERRE